MAIREIPITELITVVDENKPKATLLLDPSKRTQVFYRYQGCVINLDDPIEATPATFISRGKHCIDRGDVLVLNLLESQNFLDFINPQYLPIELLNQDLINENVLSIYKANEREIILLNKDFKLVLNVPSADVPEWAGQLVDDGKLEIVKII